MPISAISTKGQVTLPAKFRRKLRIGPNDKVVIEAAEDAIIIRKAPDFFALEGFLGKAVPLAEERQKAARHVARRNTGGRS
jgi:AbrB family looped-hinge helix DNA binding protein